jgi:hypothetical protein
LIPSAYREEFTAFGAQRTEGRFKLGSERANAGWSMGL